MVLKCATPSTPPSTSLSSTQHFTKYKSTKEQGFHVFRRHCPLWIPYGFIWIVLLPFTVFLYRKEQDPPLPFQKLQFIKQILTLVLLILVLAELIIKRGSGYKCSFDVNLPTAATVAIEIKAASFVLIALHEKGVPFKERLINLLSGEQNESWYLKMNRNGEVPVLELNGEGISESEVIIDVIDHNFTSGPPLVPDLETRPGQEVREFRMLLDDIDVSTITFGVLTNRQFCSNDLPPSLLASFDKKRVEQYLKSSHSTLAKNKSSCSPEDLPALERKLERIGQKLETVFNESEVSRNLEKLERVFDQIEERLEQSKREVEDYQDYWLVGGSFTAADITATVLMFRLHQIAITDRYFSWRTRPIVHEYFNRLMQRPSVQKMVAVSDSSLSFVNKQMWKYFGRKALKVGIIVGLVAIGFVGVREYSKFHRGLAKA